MTRGEVETFLRRALATRTRVTVNGSIQRAGVVLDVLPERVILRDYRGHIYIYSRDAITSVTEAD
jgi:hypothetical protein